MQFFLPRSLLDWLFLVSLDSAQMCTTPRALSMASRTQASTCPHPTVFLQETSSGAHNMPGTVRGVGGAGQVPPTRRPRHEDPGGAGETCRRKSRLHGAARVGRSDLARQRRRRTCLGDRMPRTNPRRRAQASRTLLGTWRVESSGDGPREVSRGQSRSRQGARSVA